MSERTKDALAYLYLAASTAWFLSTIGTGRAFAWGAAMTVGLGGLLWLGWMRKAGSKR